MGSGDKEMTLRIRIAAMGEEARKVLRGVENQLNALHKTASRFGEVAAKPFAWARSLASMIFAPLKIGAGILGGVAAGMAALGVASVKAAADDQALEERLAAVWGSAARGKEVFRALEAQTRRSAFSTEDLSEALMHLKTYGLASQKNLFALMTAAKASGSGIGELSLQVMALQARGLKRFGIELDPDASGRVAISWRDASGKISRIMAATADDARAKLMDVLSLRFGTDVKPTSLKAWIAVLKNNIGQAFANFGDALLPGVTALVQRAAEALRGLIEKGTIADWGVKVAGALKEAFVYGKSVFDWGSEVFAGLRSKGFGAMVDAMGTLVAGAGKIIVEGIVGYLELSKEVFIGVGEMMAAPFIKQIAAFFLKIPFLRNSVLEALAPQAPTGTHLRDFDPSYAGHTRFHSANAYEEASKQALDMLGSNGGAKLFEAGLKHVTQGGAAVVARTFASWQEIGRQTGADIGAAAGVPKGRFDEILKGNRARVEQSINPAEPALEYVRGFRYRWNGVTHKATPEMIEGQVPAGRYHVGQVTPGGIAIFVAGDQVLQADRMVQLSDQIRNAASKGRPAAAASY